MLIEISMSADKHGHGKALKETGYWGRKAAGVIPVCKSTGNILMLERSTEVQQPLTWGGAGGAIDGDESPLEATLRETREEMGYRGPIKLVHLATFTDGKFEYYNYLGFVDKEFTPELDHENSDYKWLSMQQASLLKLHPGIQWLFAKHGPQMWAMIDNATKANVRQRHWHGHVRPRDDGMRARCGGPNSKVINCFDCRMEKAAMKLGLLK